MSVLKDLQPKQLFHYFEELSRIPRGSGNEKAASDYIVNFAKSKGLFVHQDDAYNVIIKKPATAGYEQCPGVILQGHIDMVCEKNQETIHDFTKDPIKLLIEGDYIKADGTTLGADNGVAVAIAMAILERDDLSHPPLEVVLTSDEEVGMNGAKALDCSLLTGKYLINLDCGPEGVFVTGCSGGMRQKIRVKTKETSITGGYESYIIKIRGLKGGHSGVDIDQELANANKLMGRILYELSENCDIYLSHITGGAKDNAIPREADAILSIAHNDATKASDIISGLSKDFLSEYRLSDGGISVMIEKSISHFPVFDKETLDQVIKALLLIPSGVQNKSLDFKELVDTSNNLGVVETLKETIDFTSSTRSAVTTRRAFMAQQFKLLADAIGAAYEMSSEYPGWAYNPDSVLRQTCGNVYKELTGTEPEITITHGGLECGILSDKIPGLDVIALGPTAYGAHTPEEQLSISSMKRTYEFIIAVLQQLK